MDRKGFWAAIGLVVLSSCLLRPAVGANLVVYGSFEAIDCNPLIFDSIYGFVHRGSLAPP
jgi:hypothetical protein